MPDATPSLSPAAKPVFKTDAVPADWHNRPNDEKIQPNDTIKKHFTAFINAFNLSVSQLSHHIYDTCGSLLKNGKFIDGATPLPPVTIPSLSLIEMTMIREHFRPQ
ncbi:hypothetical protein CIB48_g10177 [Xylaria polymorpha]|nr:hypothetical protein CIB48_g10177 [Xylaria polymorpha]